MKVYYLNEYEELICEAEQIAVPNIGQQIFFEDLFFVQNVIWFPLFNSVNIYLAGEDEKRMKNTPLISDTNQIQNVRTLAEKAMKKVDELNHKISNIKDKQKHTAFKERNKNDYT